MVESDDDDDDDDDDDMMIMMMMNLKIQVQSVHLAYILLYIYDLKKKHFIFNARNRPQISSTPPAPPDRI